MAGPHRRRGFSFTLTLSPKLKKELRLSVKGYWEDMKTDCLIMGRRRSGGTSAPSSIAAGLLGWAPTLARVRDMLEGREL